MGSRSGNSSPGLNFRSFTLLFVCCSVPINTRSVHVFCSIPQEKYQNCSFFEIRDTAVSRYLAQALLE